VGRRRFLGQNSQYSIADSRFTLTDLGLFGFVLREATFGGFSEPIDLENDGLKFGFKSLGSFGKNGYQSRVHFPLSSVQRSTLKHVGTLRTT
jgi:hypothetical protein